MSYRIVSTSEYRELMEDSGAPVIVGPFIRWQAARIARKCSGCKRGIRPGERYARMFSLVDGEPHIDCAHDPPIMATRDRLG